MKKIFVISDTHFNHEAILDFESRSKWFEKDIIRKWNNIVSNDDLVVHLWDVIFDRPWELKDYLSQMKGTKVLVRWNHDKKSIVSYMNAWFSFVCDEFKFNQYTWFKIIFSHIPLPNIPDGYYNIHWHIHSWVHRWDIKLSDRHILYNPEKTWFNLCPVMLDNLIKKHLQKYIK